MHFVPPVLAGVDPEAVARFGRAVDRIYEYQDRLLGELLAAVDPSTVVIVVSDHGFVNGPDRPVGLTADIEGQPGRWHRQFGILAMSGGPIVRGPLPATSLLDLLPTALYLAGLPVPEDIRGRPLIDFIDPGFRDRFPVRRIASYRSGSFTPDTGPVTATMAAVEETFVEKLRSLGYIGEPGAPGGRSAAGDATPGGGLEPAGPATTAGRVPAASHSAPGLPTAADTVTAHANLAGALLADGRLAEAEREILAAIAMVPDFRPARHQLVELRSRQGRIGDAIAAAEGLLREGGGINPLFLNRVAELYLQAGRGEEGMARFRTAVQGGHWIFGVALSRLQIGTGDPAGAAGTALAVLDQDPLNEPAMAVLFRALPAEQRAAGIEARLDRALKINGRAVMFLNWKAILIEERGDRDQAEALLQSALATHPDHGGTVANLGAFYLRRNLPAKATPLLRRAITLEPANLEARVNLGTAMAMGGDLNGAIQAWEEAARRGVRTVDLFNALARAHHDQGDDTAAVRWLKQSLDLDPTQEDVRQTLMQVDPGHASPPR
jgi:tetratricopeptide (TPR) repeat protein